VLDEAADVAQRLERVRGGGVELQRRIDKLQGNLQALSQSQERLDSRISDASRVQHQSEAAEREFANASKHLTRQGKLLGEARAEVERIFAAAEMEPSDSEGIAVERGRLARTLEELTARLPQVNAAPLLLALLEDLNARLLDAENQDLGNQAILGNNDGEVRQTVAELRAALQQSRDYFSKSAPSAEAEDLEKRIGVARRRIAALTEAESATADLRAAQVSYGRAEKRLRSAADNLPDATIRDLQTLIAERKEAEQSAAVLQQQLARAVHQRELLGGGMTEESLSARLVELCKIAGVRAARINGERDKQGRGLGQDRRMVFGQETLPDDQD
jgi:hypothetical protein